jgi:hypothetical protein
VVENSEESTVDSEHYPTRATWRESDKHAGDERSEYESRNNKL